VTTRPGLAETPALVIANPDPPDWYKEAVIYEVHVRSFRDSDGDGVGDFQGLIDRLDHIASLGATAVWVLPFYPSPLRDDGYAGSSGRRTGAG
jgi:maltose alpha-D-glucosyltransferase / alpha-amylase